MIAQFAGGAPRVHASSARPSILPVSANVAAGAWVAENPGAVARSYHINALYSPWVSWPELVAEFDAAKHNPEKLQVFVNTALGETWDAGQAAVDPASLEARAETLIAMAEFEMAKGDNRTSPLN